MLWTTASVLYSGKVMTKQGVKLQLPNGYDFTTGKEIDIYYNDRGDILYVEESQCRRDYVKYGQGE